MKKHITTEDFIKEAHKEACPTWKAKIEKELDYLKLKNNK